MYDKLRTLNYASNIDATVIRRNTELGINLDVENWTTIFRKAICITIDTKLRFFRCKIQYKKLSTNVELAKWKENQSTLCTYCNSKPETIVHLFWECKLVKRLREKVKIWMSTELDVDVNLSLFGILFNN